MLKTIFSCALLSTSIYAADAPPYAILTSIGVPTSIGRPGEQKPVGFLINPKDQRTWELTTERLYPINLPIPVLDIISEGVQVKPSDCLMIIAGAKILGLAVDVHPGVLKTLQCLEFHDKQRPSHRAFALIDGDFPNKFSIIFDPENKKLSPGGTPLDEILCAFSALRDGEGK